MFHGSHDFVISNSDFRTCNHYGQSGIDILREACSLGATMDSPEHYDRRCCFLGTREQYISDITNWATASIDTLPSIYWMKGPAGVGKSAIAQTCAENLGNAGYLGAAFFFTVKRHNNPLRLFTTIAHQLATFLPDYRAIVDDKISKDKNITGKRISSQFKLLIVEPLQQLEKQGRGVGRRAVFIDGLDECADKASQAEIIDIIASSVQARSTPFRWAIFSREEPHIVSTFASQGISSHCHSVFLPISRDADQDVELYLRGGFENILKRRNFLHLSSSWPTAEQIKKLVDAAAGLFAHPAAVLRFIDQHSYSGFKKTLEAVLASITNSGSPSISPYAELDGLYMLILQRVPSDILAPMSLLLAELVQGFDFGGIKRWRTGILCNKHGVSETVFKSICHHLQAVVSHHPPQPYPPDETTMDLTRLYDDQESPFEFSPQIRHWLANIHGVISFYHKSFYDFLVDPTCSLTFCVATPTIREKFFDRYIQQHHYYASSYVIQGSFFFNTFDMYIYSALQNFYWRQAWPVLPTHSLGLKGQNLWTHFSSVGPFFTPLYPHLPSLGFRKHLLADIMLRNKSKWSGGIVAGCPGSIRVLPHYFWMPSPGQV